MQAVVMPLKFVFSIQIFPTGSNAVSSPDSNQISKIRSIMVLLSPKLKKEVILNHADQLTAGKISRRQFIMTAIAAGATLPMAMSIATNAVAATPVKGGRLRQGLGYGSTTDTLDPGTAENGYTQALHYSYGNQLTEVGSDGKLIGELAESFEPADGAKTWVFNLRQGVEFHNGKTLTADDVIATYNYHRDENSKSAAKGLLTAVTSMKKDGDNRVIFELEGGNADFPYIVSDYHLIIQPSKDGAIDALSGMGTGGYILDNFEPGVRAVSKRNPNYFKEGAAHFDEIELLAILDVTARQNAVMNGDVDTIDNIDPKTVALLARAPNLTILETTGTQHYTFPMRLDIEPFGNRDLRLALKYAIKRQELVDKILLGHGVAGNDIPVSSAMPYMNTGIEQREFNPEKAAEHYKKSGHSGPIQLSTSDAAFPGAVDAKMATGQTCGTKKAGALATGVVDQRKTGCIQQPIQPTQNGTTPVGKKLTMPNASTKLLLRRVLKPMKPNAKLSTLKHNNCFMTMAVPL